MGKIMTNAHFIVKDEKLVEACEIPDDIKFGWVNSAIIRAGYMLDTKVMDVCPIIFAQPFNLGVIHLAYNTPYKKFDVEVECGKNG